MEHNCYMRISPIQRRARALMASRGMSVKELANRIGRKREDVQRSLSAPHAWRMDRLVDYASALGVKPGDFFEDAASPSFHRLARHRRWDDRLSTRDQRMRRLEGPERFREIARILEGVPMEAYWRDLDFSDLYACYPEIRPHLTRSRGMWDAILPLLARRA